MDLASSSQSLFKLQTALLGIFVILKRIIFLKSVISDLWLLVIGDISVCVFVLPQAIQEHRRTANNPLYWTNRDVCDWLKDIQLEVGSGL